MVKSKIQDKQLNINHVNNVVIAIIKLLGKKKKDSSKRK